MLTMILFALGLAVVGLTVSYTAKVTAGGVVIQNDVTRTGDALIAYEVTLPAGKAGTLSTRTDDDTGVVTATGHGLVVSDKVNVFWATGKRYGMTVSAVAGNDVTVGTGAGEVGAGDAFPAQATAVVITKQVQINTSIDGDLLELLAIVAESTSNGSTSKAHIDMQDSGGASIEAIDLTANQPKVWDIDGGATNVFTGNVITKSMAANGSSTESLTLKVAGVQDATP